MRTRTADDSPKTGFLSKFNVLINNYKYYIYTQKNKQKDGYIQTTRWRTIRCCH